jgi:hypothetical protein
LHIYVAVFFNLGYETTTYINQNETGTAWTLNQLSLNQLQKICHRTEVLAFQKEVQSSH